MPSILVVEQDPEMKEIFVNGLSKEVGYQVEAARDGSLAKSFIDKNKFDFVITDIEAQDTEGQNIFDYIVDKFPETRCIILSKNASIRDSVEAIKKGAIDFLASPVNIEELIKVIKNAEVESRFCRHRRREEDQTENHKFGDLVGKSPEITAVFNKIKKVANTDSTVLITGESGTGKELIAMAIHCNSDRCEKPLVVINCGAIPGELLESELFGHEKGAFTGAHRTRIGRFEIADGGSIFLDEIGDMSPDLQVKLLRVLQEQSFERVGSTKSIKVDIRIIAATNKNLKSSIEAGSFREDLYYRLNVIPIEVPPLRKRKSDIPLLINHFLKRLGGRRRHERKRMKSFSDQATDLLMEYDWPGNIRELENMIERLSVLVENDVIQVQDLPDRIRGELPGMQKHALISLQDGFGFNDAVENYQKNLILQALKQTNWIKSKAAELLKMNRTTLVEKIKKMQIEEPRGGSFVNECS
jgi:DNA-binding NtrC family response regulator